MNIYNDATMIFTSGSYINLAVNNHTASPLSSCNLSGGFAVISVRDLVMITLGNLSCGVVVWVMFLLCSGLHSGTTLS